MDELRERLRHFLEGQSTLALATVNADGTPAVAPVFFAVDAELTLLWLSSPASRHSLNLAERPSVAGTVYPAVEDWLAIRGVQLEGEAHEVTDPQRRDGALALYRRRFPLPAAFDSVIEGSALYALRPSWFRWVDNGEGFGHKAELRLPPRPD